MYHMGRTTITNSEGLIACNRYAYPPNSLHYCGPGVSSENVSEHLQKFETLYPYLVLIAQANNITDPFDPRVVEAYWLGNNLLLQVKVRAFGDHLADRMKLRKKLPSGKFHALMDHIVDGVPQHNFHVLNIFLRTGHQMVAHTLETMDNCRISWGKVVTPNTMKTRPLVYKDDTLILGEPVLKTFQSIELQPKIGDWVSLHWGMICEVLTEEKCRNLAISTKRAIDHANKNNPL